jgi:hypothetical protein
MVFSRRRQLVALFGAGSNGRLRRRSGGAPQRHRRLLLQNHARQYPKGGGTADLPLQRAWRGVINDNPRNALFGCIRVHPTIADADPILTSSTMRRRRRRGANASSIERCMIIWTTQSATFRSRPDSAERHLGRLSVFRLTNGLPAAA